MSAVRVGRRVELTVAADDEAAARAIVERLAVELLSNPLIEAFEVEALGAASSIGRGAAHDASGSASSSSRARTATSTRSTRSSVAGAEPVDAVARAGVARRRRRRSSCPGGFAYGDYLRAGVIARFSPVMRSVAAFAADGGLVLGICNGFQVLTEAASPARRAAPQPRPAVRRRARSRSSPERLDTPFTRAIGERRPLRMPVAHGEGCYFADDATLDELERDGQVLFRYVRADGTAAGDEGDRGEPERLAAGDRRRDERGRQRRRPDAPSRRRAVEAVLGSDDGLGIIRSFVESAAERAAAGAARRGRRPMTLAEAAASADRRASRSTAASA